MVCLAYSHVLLISVFLCIPVMLFVGWPLHANDNGKYGGLFISRYTYSRWAACCAGNTVSSICLHLSYPILSDPILSHLISPHRMASYPTFISSQCSQSHLYFLISYSIMLYVIPSLTRHIIMTKNYSLMYQHHNNIISIHMYHTSISYHHMSTAHPCYMKSTSGRKL